MKKSMIVGLMIALFVIAGPVSAADLVPGGDFGATAIVDDTAIKDGEQNSWRGQDISWVNSAGVATSIGGGGLGLWADNTFTGTVHLEFDYTLSGADAGKYIGIEVFTLTGSGSYVNVPHQLRLYGYPGNDPVSDANYTVVSGVNESIAVNGSGTYTSTASFDLTGVASYQIRITPVSSPAVTIDNVSIVSSGAPPTQGTVIMVK